MLIVELANPGCVSSRPRPRHLAARALSSGPLEPSSLEAKGSRGCSHWSRALFGSRAVVGPIPRVLDTCGSAYCRFREERGRRYAPPRGQQGGVDWAAPSAQTSDGDGSWQASEPSAQQAPPQPPQPPPPPAATQATMDRQKKQHVYCTMPNCKRSWWGTPQEVAYCNWCLHAIAVQLKPQVRNAVTNQIGKRSSGKAEGKNSAAVTSQDQV